MPINGIVQLILDGIGSKVLDNLLQVCAMFVKLVDMQIDASANEETKGVCLLFSYYFDFICFILSSSILTTFAQSFKNYTTFRPRPITS